MTQQRRGIHFKLDYDLRINNNNNSNNNENSNTRKAVAVPPGLLSLLKIQECLNTFRCFPFGPRQETENRQTDREVGRAMIRPLFAGLSPRCLEFDASVVHLGLL